MASSSRRVINLHTKKEEALQALIKKSKKVVENRLEQVDASGSIPPELLEVVRPFKDKMERLKGQALQGQPVFQNSIEVLTDDDISCLRSIFQKKSGVHSEENIMKAAKVMLASDLTKLEDYTITWGVSKITSF